MRISDWSSDVCSSDLDQPIDQVPPTQRARRRVLRPYLPCQQLVGAGDHPVSGRALDDFTGLAVIDHRSAWRGELRHRTMPLDVMIHEPRELGLEPLLRPGRSEEHTSELQSLMRISYAVFFLKTKNNAQ